MSRTLPREIPEELKAALKCVPVDPDWPIQGPMHALELLLEWDTLIGQPQVTIEDHVQRLTHSHAMELMDLATQGYVGVYQKSLSTKYISISWHLAGRYCYDDELVKWLVEKGWLEGSLPGKKLFQDPYQPGDPFFVTKSAAEFPPDYEPPAPLRLVDFGAACWVQSIFYAKKGLDVTAINSSLDSDANRFGRWMAKKSGLPEGAIKEYASTDPTWRQLQFDIVYAVDVLEHIPPLDEDQGAYKKDSPGWIPYAHDLLRCLAPGGLWYANAPLERKEGRPVPQEHHPVHFTSPILLPEWEEAQGLVNKGSFTRFKPVAELVP